MASVFNWCIRAMSCSTFWMNRGSIIFLISSKVWIRSSIRNLKVCSYKPSSSFTERRFSILKTVIFRVWWGMLPMMRIN